VKTSNFLRDLAVTLGLCALAYLAARIAIPLVF